MKKNILSLLFVCLSFCAYSQNEYTTPHAAYVDGEQLLVYDNDKVFISAIARITSQDYGFGNDLKIALSITNKSDTPFNFIPEESTAYEIRKGKEKELKVYSSKEFLKRMRKNILWFGPDNVENVSVSTEVKDGTGKKIGSVSSKTQVYTGAADEAFDNAEEYVRKNYLKKNTLIKGNEVKGVLAVQKPKGDSVFFNLKVGEDVYVFNFLLEQ